MKEERFKEERLNKEWKREIRGYRKENEENYKEGEGRKE